MTWNTSTRRQRLPRNWPAIRLTCLQRDRFLCQWIRADTGTRCNATANQADHITPGDDHRLTNLQSLCEYHHNKKSSQEGGTARAAKQQRNNKNQGQTHSHPGIRE